jgi:hypothetical protein
MRFILDVFKEEWGTFVRLCGLSAVLNGLVLCVDDFLRLQNSDVWCVVEKGIYALDGSFGRDGWCRNS